MEIAGHPYPFEEAILDRSDNIANSYLSRLAIRQIGPR